MTWQMHQFPEVLSTNETAKAFPDHAVIISQRQSGGKGRYGRPWISPAGNLYLSAVIGGLGDLAPFMAFGAGLATAEALSAFNARLKWPNDVLIDGKKVAGILLERTTDDRLIVGIGVNVVSCPDTGMLYQTTHLNGQISLSDLTDRILAGLTEATDILTTRGFEDLRRRWLALAVGRGQSVRVRLPDRDLIGIFQDLSPQGELVLVTPARTVHISAGDVFLL